MLVLVGPGNNGGDGLVAARYLEEWGIGVTVYVWRREVSPDPHLARVEALGIPIIHAQRDPDYAGLAQFAADADVIIDALLGTGASGPLRGNLPELLAVVRTAVPSGARRARARNACCRRLLRPLVAARWLSPWTCPRAWMPTQVRSTRARCPPM